MIIRLLLLRLICFLYIVLFVVSLVFLSYMDTTKDLWLLMIFPVVIVRLKYLFNVSNVLNVDPLTLCFQLILFLMLISYANNKHYICPPIHYTSYFLFNSLETSLMLSRYAFSTGVKVISWYFLYSDFAFSNACLWLTEPAPVKSFLFPDDNTLSSCFT